MKKLFIGLALLSGVSSVGAMERVPGAIDRGEAIARIQRYLQAKETGALDLQSAALAFLDNNFYKSGQTSEADFNSWLQGSLQPYLDWLFEQRQQTQKGRDSLGERMLSHPSKKESKRSQVTGREFLDGQRKNDEDIGQIGDAWWNFICTLNGSSNPNYVHKCPDLSEYRGWGYNSGGLMRYRVLADECYLCRAKLEEEDALEEV